MGALKRGDLVVDPFGGIGTTAVEGATRGLRVIVHELEPKFVTLAQQNFDLHARAWDAMGWTQPVAIQGDSRNLRQSIHGRFDALVSSPPYATIVTGAGGLNTKPARDGQQGGRSPSSPSQATDQRYGSSDGQLARMASGIVEAVISSPPYNLPSSQDHNGSRGGTRMTTPSETGAFVRYGNTPGQLEGLSHGDVEAVITSPPYSESISYQRPVAGETFWSAALDIVRESHAIMKPGGVAVWVVKKFVRRKQIVDFPGDWKKLCEYVGFEVVSEVRAMLVAEEVNDTLFEGEVTKRRERKSFFRRLAEKRGCPPIDFETVWIMKKGARVVP